MEIQEEELMNLEADSLTVVAVGPTTERALPETRSFSEALRNALKSFVEWIDNIDVDGQQYWA